MIILDLDDTIFKTSSIDPRIFDSAINTIKKFYNNENIIDELWEKPMDTVFEKYSIPNEVREEFYVKISEIDFKELEIKPFIDYSEIKQYGFDIILVTTGLTELQNAKIDALGIRNDFVDIFIDDPRTKPRNTKFQIFEQILRKTEKTKQEIWVIGDNPNSEIEAAYQLGINTIQRKSKSKMKSKLANFYIKSFTELSEILSKRLKGKDIKNNEQIAEQIKSPDNIDL